jgi:hypothetical protein
MKNAMKCFALACLAMIALNAQGQRTDKMKEEDVVVGSIIRDGKEIQGYIKAMGWSAVGDKVFSAPWEFQKDIRFMEKETFEKAEKIRNKDYEKLEAGDIDGYKYRDSLVYESVKYADMSAVGAGMIPKKMFMRKVSDGKISLYVHFGSPMVVGESHEFEQSYIDSAVPNYVYRIGKDGKLKLVNSLNVKKELADCPAVVEKYEKGDYGVQAGEEKKSGLAKLADKTIARDGVRFGAIDDYNNVCK